MLTARKIVITKITIRVWDSTAEMRYLVLPERPAGSEKMSFSAQELWGEQASPRHSVYIDMWDDYLEHA